jgi:pimeloyl-ACP methyl ester carboxylesterase
VSGVTIVTTRDGVSIAVRALGGAGTPAVLAHANGFHAMVLTKLAACLARDLRCVGPDLRGHGLSGVPAGEDFSWSGFALDVLATVDFVCPPGPDGCAPSARPVGVGHSLGGTALLLAEAARPGTFAALYCYEPILIPAELHQPKGTPSSLSTAARRRRDTFDTRREALEHLRARPVFAHADPDVLESYTEHGLVVSEDGALHLACRPEHEALVFDAGYRCDALEQVGTVACPVTIAVGGLSTGFGPSSAALAVRRLPHGQSVTLAGLGHLGPLEAPDAVARSALATFAEAGVVSRAVTPPRARGA